MQKKPYTSPKLIDHGSVVRETKGMFGSSYETMGRDIWEMDRNGATVGFTKTEQEK